MSVIINELNGQTPQEKGTNEEPREMIANKQNREVQFPRPLSFLTPSEESK